MAEILENASDAGVASEPDQTSRRDLWNQALKLQRSGQVSDAITLYHRLARVQGKDDPVVWMHLGAALRSQGKHQAALLAARRVLESNPKSAASLGNYANALKDLGRLDEAVKHHHAAVGVDPGSAHARFNLGVSLRESGRMAEALEQFDLVIKLTPDDPRPYFDRALALLHLGRFPEGWDAFETRWGLDEISKAKSDAPEWQGEDFQGRTLVLYPEQGFGDTILASRFLPLVKARGGDVVLICKPELRRLFKYLDGVDRLLDPDDQPETIDFQCPLMSLPRIFQAAPDNLPSPPQLHVPDDARRKIQPLIERAGNRFKVGFVWSGSLTFKGNATRATSLDRFLELAEVPGIQLYSLQKGPLEHEISEIGAEAVVVDAGSQVNDFAETAAVIEQLDLVIMTDSSVAHLCGALGRPIWNLLNFSPYWLYRMHGETTPWYPSMTLIRQQRPGDWDQVFETVQRRLSQAVAEKRLLGQDAADSNIRATSPVG